MMWKAVTIAILATLARPTAPEAPAVSKPERARVDTAEPTDVAIPTMADLPAPKLTL